MNDLSLKETDHDVAAQIKTKVAALLVECTAIMDSAARHQMQIQFALGRDQFGKNCIASLNVIKVLA